MNHLITVLILQPNEKPVLKEIYNSLEEIARIIGIDEADLGIVNMSNFEIYYPRFIEITYCLRKGFFPTTLILMNKRDHKDRELFKRALEFSNMTIDKAYAFLDELNIEYDELIDHRKFYSEINNFMDFVENRVLHNEKLSAISKALFVFIQRNNFEITLTQIKEYFIEEPQVIEEGIGELIELKVLKETRLANMEERYFIINTDYLKEIEDTALIEYASKSNNQSNNSTKEYTFLKQNDIDDKESELMKDIKEFIVKEQKASTSLLQRKFRIGYSRAARIMDLLEEQGFVSASNGSKPREVLVKNVESH
ncbi:hypothetical protein UACE39S_02958 [Ureibacillus acetophenoni]